MPNRYAALMVFIMMALAIGACSSITGGSEVSDLETQNAQLQSTIQMVGTPMLTIAALEQQATQNVVLQAQATQLAVQLLSSQATLTVLELSGGAGAVAVQATPQSPIVSNNDQPQATLPPITNSGVTPSPAPGGDTNTTSASGTRFSETVTARDRDNQDCAVGVTTTFSPATETIYVFMRINTLTAGSVIGARWTVDGEEFVNDSECWIPNRNYSNICAYCSIVPDGSVFQSGQWTVELSLDGQVLSQAQFQVTGGETSESSMDDETDMNAETDTTN